MPDRLRPLWDFEDVERTEERLREQLEREGSAAGRAEVLTQLARVHSLRDEFDDCEAVLQRAESLSGDALVRVRVDLERGRKLRSSGDGASAAPLFESAFARASELGEFWFAGDAAHMVAIAVPEETVEWTERGLALAEAEPDARYWAGPLLNNLGWHYYDAGEYERALAVFESALEVRLRDPGNPQAIQWAEEAVAEARKALGPTTWHHGLVADYWATVNLDAPELDLYRKHLRSPVLDAGCGAGRLLVPLRREGFDVDGCDASADMIDRCRQRAPDATLWVSRLHELAPPRRYASVVCSGVLGLGSTREQDLEALSRLHEALLPGGTLVLDNEESPFRWRVRDWGEPSGGEISLRVRVDAVDEGDGSVQMTIRAETPDGRREEHALTMRHWYRDELVPALHAAGFATVDVLRGVDEKTMVYVAARSEGGR